MKLVSFTDVDPTPRIGVDTGSELADLTAAGLGNDLVDLIAQWDQTTVEQATATAPRLPKSQVRLLAPLRPRKNIFAVGRNYHDHAREFSRSGFDASEKKMIPEHPVMFTKAPTSVIGPEDPINLANDPTASTDYEGELGVVIARPCRRVDPEHVLEYVFGWTIVNDVTARNLQQQHVQWFIGKSPDTFCPMGPCVVTIDELPDIYRSRLRTTVNDELRQDALISDLIFNVETLIATLAEVMTLEPGDVIATGTPAGVGIGFDPPRYLAPGDVVEVTIDGIGTLRNPVQ